MVLEFSIFQLWRRGKAGRHADRTSGLATGAETAADAEGLQNCRASGDGLRMKDVN